MINEPPFPGVLRRVLVAYGIRPYRLALNSRVSNVTICKIMNYGKYRICATEAQVLRMFVGVVCDEKRRWEILDLVEQNDTVFFAKLAKIVDPKTMTCERLAILANVGEKRLQEARAGRRPLSDALKLRLVIEARCASMEIDLANVLLQAGGFYIMRGGAEGKEAAA